MKLMKTEPILTTAPGFMTTQALLNVVLMVALYLPFLALYVLVFWIGHTVAICRQAYEYGRNI